MQNHNSEIPKRCTRISLALLDTKKVIWRTFNTNVNVLSSYNLNRITLLSSKCSLQLPVGSSQLDRTGKVSQPSLVSLRLQMARHPHRIRRKTCFSRFLFFFEAIQRRKYAFQKQTQRPTPPLYSSDFEMCRFKLNTWSRRALNIIPEEIVAATCQPSGLLASPVRSSTNSFIYIFLIFT